MKALTTIRYSVVDKVLDIELRNSKYPGLLMGSYKTCYSTWVAEHALLYYPSLNGLREMEAPLIRINSACFTGDILGDRRCDCSDQLQLAMQYISNEGGLIIYHLHHEGRGLGLTSKLRTYQQMDEINVSTFGAMSAIANRADLRTYGSAVLILNDLGIHRIRLMTNNPNKRLVLEENGIEVVEVVGVLSKRPELTRYLKSKREEQGHAIEFAIAEPTIKPAG